VQNLPYEKEFDLHENDNAGEGKGKGKVCIRAKWLIRPEPIPVSVA